MPSLLVWLFIKVGDQLIRYRLFTWDHSPIILGKNRIKHSHSHIQNIHTHSNKTFLIKIAPQQSPEFSRSSTWEQQWSKVFWDFCRSAAEQRTAFILLITLKGGTPPKWLKFCFHWNQDNDWLHFGGNVFWCSNRDWQVSCFSKASTTQSTNDLDPERLVSTTAELH